MPDPAQHGASAGKASAQAPHSAAERKGERGKQPKQDSRTTDQRIADLELQLAQSRAGTPLGTLPFHGAGVETDVAETWSQHDQEQANAGTHPDQQQDDDDDDGDEYDDDDDDDDGDDQVTINPRTSTGKPVTPTGNTATGTK